MEGAKHLKHGLYGLQSEWFPAERHSSVARALAAKARCPGFDSRRRHFLCSPKLFQRSTDSNDANHDLFRQVALRASDLAPSIGFVFGRSFFHRALLCLRL